MTDISTDTVTLATNTTSYPRPLTDFVGEVVHVVSFVPAGTALSAVTDWGPIWNSALNECRSIIQAGKTFGLIGPDCEQTFQTQVNGTFVTVNGTSTGITSFGSFIDFQSALLICATPGKATFDFMTCWFMTFHNLVLQGGIGGTSANTNSVPTIGFQWGRAIPNSNADTNSFYNVKTNGSFSLAAMYCNAAESNNIFGAWISNNVATAQMSGVVAVRGTPVSGAAKVAYALIVDALGHWQVPTLNPGGMQFAPETSSNASYVSFEQFTVYGSTITCGSGSAMWISSGTNHHYHNCYLNCGSTVSCIDWYRLDNDAPQNFRFDIHCETASKAGYATLFNLIGDVDVNASICDGFSFTDGGTVFDSYFMTQALTNTPNNVMVFTNCNIQISKANNASGSTGGSLFSNPNLFYTDGRIAIPNYLWNGVANTGLGYGHSGFLGLNYTTSNVTSYIGLTQFNGSLSPASLTTTLGELGITVAQDSVSSVTMTQGGNYYLQTTAFSNPVTFSAAPSGGATATGTALYSGTSYGWQCGAAGTGYTTANGVTVQDANGKVVPFTASITASGGALTSVAFYALTGTLAQIPAGPLKVVQSGGSGGTVSTALFSITGVTIINNGSGYQTSPTAVTVTFDGAHSSPAATGVVNLSGSLNSFNVVAGQRIGLDANGTKWIEEDSMGKVVVGSGATRLFSIDASGNLVAKGTLTGSGSP